METPEPPAPRPRLADLMRSRFEVKSFGVNALFGLAVIYTLYFTRSILLPLVLAVLLSYLFAPLVRFLARLKIPPLLGSGVVLATVLAIAGLLVARLATPAAAWVQKAPYSLHRMQDKMSAFKKPIQNVSDASAQIEKMTTTDSADAKKTVVQVKSNRLSDLVFSQTPELLAQAVTMMILLYFLLAYDQIFLAKLIKVMPRLADKKRAITIAHKIEESISKYLVTITIINICLGTVIGLATWFLGLQNPVLWGAMAATLNFVPYLGATVGIVAMTLGAVLSFDSLGWALVFPATYLIVAILEGNFITPMILGHSLTLNPIVIVISLMFWGWMWGIAGAILAVPILATLKIFCDHIEPLAPVGEFLST